jgi:tetratricopeptide (TPR) repeat protein
MLLPEDRYNFSAKKKKKKGRLGFLLFGIVLVAAAVGSVLYLNYSDSLLKREKSSEEVIKEYWRVQKYKELIDLTESELLEDPLHPTALVFNGFSSFYQSTREFTLEEKLPYLDKSVLVLRKALLLDEIPLREGVYYVLGKAYYHKGRYYSDLAVKYLHKSLEAGYSGEDTYEYLGLAYNNMENYAEAAKYFGLAVEKRPTDVLYLTLAQIFIKLGRDDEVEEYLIRAVNMTGDLSLEERSRYLLANFYMQKGELLKAEDQYKKIVEKNENAADAHFHLGEIYNKMNDTVKARAEWRKTLSIDPSHYGARLNLYN